MTLLGVATSYFVQHLVDSVLVRHEGRLLNALGVGMVLILLFRTLFGVLRQYLLAHVGRKVDLALIAGYARHILGLPLQFFEMRRVGEILSRVNDAAKVREAISGTTLTAVVDGTLVVLLLAVLWLYDVPLALVATAFVPLLVAERGRAPPGRAAALARGDGAGRPALGPPGRGRLRRGDGQGLRRRAARGRRRGRRGWSRLVQSCFALQKLGISMSTPGHVRDGASPASWSSGTAATASWPGR